MKKTLIALLSLFGVSIGADNEITLNTDYAFTSATYTLPTTWTETGATLTMVLDVTSFAALFDSATASARPVFASMVANDNAIFGLEAHESKRITGSYGVTAGGTYNNLYTLGANNADSISDIDWTKVKAAALTMSYTYAHGTGWTLTVFDIDGLCTSVVTPDNVLRNQNATDIISFAIDTNVVTKAYAADGFYRGDDAIILNKQAIAANVPEPTTVTLSLLAFAGLVVRRRRKSR